jgi:serine/threonine protein kinase
MECAMRLECPHCHNGIDVVLRSPAEAISCPECGSTFSLFDPEKTTSYHEPDTTILGRFRLLDHVGSGHYGDVWKAHDATLDREVALKLPRKESLTPDEVERFVREARVAAQIRHPNVVNVHEVIQSGDRVFIVSEFIRGVNLANWLSDHKPDAMEAARLCAPLSSALHHAHEVGIVHRDLKPANVLIDLEGELHLTDFGLAKRDGAEITMTLGGEILGTPAYMSPEQARGDAHNADRRSDESEEAKQEHSSRSGYDLPQGVGKSAGASLPDGERHGRRIASVHGRQTHPHAADYLG